MGWSDCSSRGMPSSEYGSPGCVGHFETDEASQPLDQWINPICHHQAAIDPRTTAVRKRIRPHRRSTSKFLSRSRPIHKMRSSDEIGASNIKRFIEVLTIGVETVVSMDPISQFRQVAIPFASRKFASRKISRSRFASRNFLFANFLPFGRAVGPEMVLPLVTLPPPFFESKNFLDINERKKLCQSRILQSPVRIPATFRFPSSSRMPIQQGRSSRSHRNCFLVIPRLRFPMVRPLGSMIPASIYRLGDTLFQRPPQPMKWRRLYVGSNR